MTENNNEDIKKFPIEKCIVNFKNYILGEEFNPSQKPYIYINKQDLLSFGIRGDLSSVYLSAIAYKIYLGYLPIDKNLQQWISITFNKRITYSQLKGKYFLSQINNKNVTKNSFIKNINKNNENNTINNENDKELKNLINLDLTRTFQEIPLFKDEKILKILFNVLFIYSKEHANTNPYKQGMNEIISILFLSIYPCYFEPKKNISRIDIVNAINSFNKRTKIVLHKSSKNELNLPSTNSKKGIDILFYFFQDENYLEVDLYYLFNNLMEKGLNIFYKDETLKKRCDSIINNKLKIIDCDLYNKCINDKVAYIIFLGKWLQTFFNQVTNIKNCIKILDIIISKEFLNNDINTDIYYIKKNDLFELEYLDYICLSMIKKYRKELIQKNNEEFLIFCLCYPEIKNMNEIIQSANYINLTIKNSQIDTNKINENLEKKSSLKIIPKKKKYLGNQGQNKFSSFTESNSNFYKTKKIIKNNTIRDTIESKNNTTSSTTSNRLSSSKSNNKSTRLLDTKKNNLKERNFNFFDKISSFSHQFDDLIDPYYF